jgi:hypothetical protein
MKDVFDDVVDSIKNEEVEVEVDNTDAAIYFHIYKKNGHWKTTTKYCNLWRRRVFMMLRLIPLYYDVCFETIPRNSSKIIVVKANSNFSFDDKLLNYTLKCMRKFKQEHLKKMRMWKQTETDKQYYAHYFKFICIKNNEN